MKAVLKLGVVLLAAGRSERFGGNKLLADFGGKKLIHRALEAAGALNAQKRVAVVSCGEVSQAAQNLGFDVIINDAPQLGQAHSIVLGVHSMQEMDAVLFLAGDQPLLGPQSLLLLAQRFEQSAKRIACLEDGTHWGNPAIFGREYFPQLLALEGDRGAKGIMKSHREDLLIVACVDPDELTDVDTPQALAELNGRCKKKHGRRPSQQFPGIIRKQEV